MSTTKYASRSIIILAFCFLLVAGALSLAPAGQFAKACPTGWYFAEGYTGGSFDTWILIQNPFENEVTAHVTFMTPDGPLEAIDYVVGKQTRFSIYVNSIPGLENAEVATEVKVDASGIICERAMYFDYQSGIGDRSGGHATIGAPGAGWSWYLPEGYTGQGFDTYILMMNPGTEDVNATMKLMKPGEGKYYPFKVAVPAGKRVTVKLDDLVWTEGTDNIIAANTEPPANPVQVTFDETDVSTVIYTENGPIVAERSMYFDYYGKEGGSNSIGATGAAPEWYLPEGYTADDFDTWVLAMNPSYDTVDITYTFYSNQPGFVPVSVVHKGVAPWSRDSINVDAVPGLEGTDVSTKVTATRPVTLKTAAVENPVERYAVLYGVEQNLTADPNEAYAVDDMYDLKHRLVDYCGFSYDKMRYRADDKASTDDKVTLAQMQEDMAWLASVADANDLVFFFFAGNSSAASENQIDLSNGSVSKSQLEAYFTAIKTGNLIGAFECDNSGELASELAKPGRLLMASCAKGELRHEYPDAAFTAATGDYGNGAFDYFLVEGLAMKAADVNGNGLVSAEEAFNYAKPKTSAMVIAQATAQTVVSQVPEIYDGIAGDVNLTVERVPANIVAERSIFFNYGTANDGATSIGAPTLHNTWFLAEGYTGGGFDTYVLVLNPLDNWQKVTATFMTPDGNVIEQSYDCPPNFRLTIPVDAITGLDAVDVSTRITAAYMDSPGSASAANYGGGDSGVAVERAMYFVYTDPGDGSVKTGGTCSIGFGE